jgi:hypothetical protein
MRDYVQDLSRSARGASCRLSDSDSGYAIVKPCELPQPLRQSRGACWHWHACN